MSLRTVSFLSLKSRLIGLVNLRIQNGDFTQRGLARILGISQSQVHNVLKGARKLTAELADHLMLRLDISVLDLLEADELVDQAISRRRERADSPERHGMEPGAHVSVGRLGDLHRRGTTPERAAQLKSTKY